MYHAYRFDTCHATIEHYLPCCGGISVPAGVHPVHQNIATAVVDVHRTDKQCVLLYRVASRRHDDGAMIVDFHSKAIVPAAKIGRRSRQGLGHVTHTIFPSGGGVRMIMETRKLNAWTPPPKSEKIGRRA